MDALDTLDLAEVGAYATARQGFDHGLAVLAMGQAYWLVPAPEGYRLMVESQCAASVAEELACYDREAAGWPPPPLIERSPRRRPAVLSPLLWALVTIGAFYLQQNLPALNESRMALDSQAVYGRGEWWRVATALFVHADLGHLTSNLIFGVFVFSAVATTFGTLAGWGWVALASLAANATVAALNYPGPYRSLGASTAIFAGLGLLTGRAARLARTNHRWRPVVVPLASGLALLGLLGAGGPQVDLAAHAAGFAAGTLLAYAGTVSAEDSSQNPPTVQPPSTHSA